MKSGKYEKLPRSEFPKFKKMLEDQARLEGQEVHIPPLKDGDPVDVEWTVKPKAASQP